MPRAVISFPRFSQWHGDRRREDRGLRLEWRRCGEVHSVIIGMGKERTRGYWKRWYVLLCHGMVDNGPCPWGTESSLGGMSGALELINDASLLLSRQGRRGHLIHHVRSGGCGCPEGLDIVDVG